MLVKRFPQRRGSILPMLAVTCFSLFAFIALAVDLGMLMVARTECQNAADAAALIGARTLDNDAPEGVSLASYNNKRPEAIAAATTTVRGNYLLRSQFAFTDTSIDRVEIGIYDYDATAQVFKPQFPASNASDPSSKFVVNGSTRPWTACRVTVKGDQPAYFARILGITTMPMSARATAAHRPRDIAMVLDYSGSMKFGCVSHYPPGNGNSNGAIIGLLNPDPRIPQFGHYQRYDGRSTTTPNGSNQHPLRTTVPYVMSSGEIASPNNQTYESTGGPPMVNDFYFSTNLSPTAPVNPPTLQPAFNAPGTVCPMPDTYNTQTVVNINGDRSPRKGGLRTAAAVSWDPATTQGAARSVREMLWANGSFPATPSERTIPNLGAGAGQRQRVLTSNNTIEGSTSWTSYRDDAFERHGFDLNIPNYISSGFSNIQLHTGNDRFQGYIMGPGYWGKTFFQWPPDPRFDASASLTSPDANRPSFDTSGRPMCDWRRRFFRRSNGTAFDPQSDNDAAVTGTQSINQTLFNTSAGHVLTGTTSRYTINYAAILAWLKSGPQVLPPNLRAGRILFYTQIPDDCASPTTDDQRFWREYIDFVLGSTKNRGWYNPAYCMAGTEASAWGTLSLNTTTGYKPSSATVANPLPYMHYGDTPNMPRAHFWFGPASMLMFISVRGQFSNSNEWNWNPGTVREAQSWQLKAAIQSVIDDIRKNHPNDQCGMAFFAHSNYRTPRVTMGQDWDRLKASLFFPKNYPGGADNGAFLSDVVNGVAREERPYDSNFNDRLTGNLPNANGGTDPNNGLAQAYNMLSTSTAVGSGGRRGAAKIVIFETDGVPNSYQNWNFSASGTTSKYVWIDSGAFVANGDSGSMQEAYDVVTQICASTSASSPGFSLPNAPARVYPFGFGDLFSSSSTFKPTALTFLQTIGYHGKTNTSTGTALPAEQIITGDYNTRISNLRTGLERVFQNGVQVTLIE